MAKQFDFLLSQVRTSATSLVGGKAYFYKPGTSDLADVWADQEATVPADNPVTLDANGTAQVYGEGIYRVAIYDAQNVKRFDLEDVLCADPTTITKDAVFITKWTSLTAAVAAIGAVTPTTLIINGGTSLAANTIITPNISVVCLNIGTIDQGAYTLDVQGSFTGTAARIFLGAGAVTFKKVLPDARWFNRGMPLIGEGRSGGGGHLLIRDSRDNNATRIHVEPNGIIDTGTTTKLDMMFDPYEDDIANYRIFNVFNTTGDTQAMGSPNVVNISAKSTGRFYGEFPVMLFGFNDNSSSSSAAMKIMFRDKTDSTVRTPHKGGWRAGRAVAIGDYMTSMDDTLPLANYCLYVAASAGTTGANKPVHLAGTVSDGGVSWTFVKNYTTVAQAGNFKAQVVFGQALDMPTAGHDYSVEFARGAAVKNGQSIGWMSNTGTVASKIDIIGADTYHTFGALGHKFRFTDKFVQHQMGSTLRASLQKTDLATTADVTTTDMLVHSDTAPTSFTGVTSYANQEFYMRATNANTTLVHSGNLVLKGGANRVLQSGEVLHFYCRAANVAVEVGASTMAPISTGAGAPATVPTFIGQEYLDTAASKWYKAKGTTNSADWLLLN